GCLLEPEWYVHGAEQAPRSQEMVLGAVTVAGAQVQAADPQVAACEQRTHLQFSRQRNRRQVVVLGLVNVEGTACSGFAEHVQRGGRIPAVTALPGEGQGPLGGNRCLVDATAEEVGFAE